MQNNPEESGLGPAGDDRRRCKKNSLSVLSCIDKRIKEGCDRGMQRSGDSSQRARRGKTSSSEETEGIWQKREL